MSKQKATRSLPENACRAVLNGVKGSQQKADLVLDTIRGKTVEQALADLQFSRKRLAADARKTLLSAIANAENNHQLNPDKLFVKEAWTGKNMVLKRFRPRARGRVGRILKPRVNMTIVVAEKTETQEKKA